MPTNKDRGFYEFYVRCTTNPSQPVVYRAELAPDYGNYENGQKVCTETFSYGEGDTPLKAIANLCENMINS